MADEKIHEVVPLDQETALALLAGADKAGRAQEEVRTTSTAFLVPDEILQAADLPGHAMSVEHVVPEDAPEVSPLDAAVSAPDEQRYAAQASDPEAGRLAEQKAAGDSDADVPAVKSSVQRAEEDAEEAGTPAEPVKATGRNSKAAAAKADADAKE